MELHLSAVDYFPPSNFSDPGVGPSFNSTPSEVVTYLACVSFPGCYTAQMSAGEDGKYVSRTGFGLHSPSVDIHVTDSIAPISFCISNCPVDKPFDPAVGNCAICPAGFYIDVRYKSCSACPYGSFSERAGSFSCSSCPDHLPWSPRGSPSVLNCFTIEGNVFAVGSRGRISAFLPDKSSWVAVVDEDGVLNYPESLLFLTPYFFLVANDYSSEVVVYDVTGEYKGRFADVPGPSDFLRLSDGDTLAVVSSAGNAICAYRISDALELDMRTGDLTFVDYGPEGSITPVWTLSSPNPYAISWGAKENEFITSTFDGFVRRHCVPSSDCDTHRAGTLFKAQQNTRLLGLATVRAPKNRLKDFFLVSYAHSTRPLLYKCLHSAPAFRNDGSAPFLEDSCEIFASGFKEPGGLLVDSTRNLIYVADEGSVEILVFSYEGGAPVGKLGVRVGSLMDPVNVALRPGIYAPLCFFYPPEYVETGGIVAGSFVNLTVALRDCYNSDISYFIPTLNSRIVMSASGTVALIDGTKTAVTVSGKVMEQETDSLSQLKSELQIRIAGNWTISLREEGTAAPTHIRGSPFTITVFPGASSPFHCDLIAPASALLPGTVYEFLVVAKDAYSNAVTNADDQITFTSIDGLFVELAASSPGKHVLNVKAPDPKTAAKYFALDILLNGERIRNSPFSISVEGTPVSASYDIKTVAIIAGSAGGTIFVAAYVAGLIRSYVRRSFVKAKVNSTRALVQSMVLGFLDIGTDFACFVVNVRSCENLRTLLTVILGSGLIASIIQFCMVAYYLFRSIVIGRTYEDDRLNKEYGEMLKNASASVPHSNNTVSKVVPIQHVKSLANGALSWNSKSGAEEVRAHPTPYDKFLDLMRDRRSYEDAQKDESKSVRLVSCGLFTCVFEDLPNIGINSYQIVYGCGVGAQACHFVSTFVYVATLLTVCLTALKLSAFYRVVSAHRRRMRELDELLHNKTIEANEILTIIGKDNMSGGGYLGDTVRTAQMGSGGGGGGGEK